MSEWKGSGGEKFEVYSQMVKHREQKIEIINEFT